MLSMFLVGIISWWYTGGIASRWRHANDSWAATVEFFSVGQLLTTLFSPYRQISAGRVQGSLSAVVRAAFDKLFSRIIGAIIRSFTIIFGAIVIYFQFIYQLLVLLFWLFVPLLPIIGVIIFAFGWVPQWM